MQGSSGWESSAGLDRMPVRSELLGVAAYMLVVLRCVQGTRAACHG